MIRIDDDLIPLTDAGNAQLFTHDHGADLRWVPQWGTWMRYDGRRWVRSPAETLVPLAIRTARAIYGRAADEPDEERRRRLVGHALAMESRGKLDAMIAIARGLLVASADEFDRDPYTVNLESGTLVLRLNGFNHREHRREDMLTRLAPVAFDPAAACPRWDTFLARVLPDEGVRAWLQRYLGYALTGDVGEQVLAFLYGTGANGKSTLLEMIAHVLGDYARAGAPDLLLAKHGESHPTELADLQGARLVVCQETEAGRQWAESLVKRLTGGDRIKARYMRCDFFEFEATHKLVVSANHRPRVRGQDEGIWRRIRLVPFAVTIPAEERDPDLPEALRAEAAGILRWLVEGCVLWQRDGLGEVRAISEATRAYRTEQDVIAHFVEEECEVVADAFAAHADLYSAYQSWCARVGETAWKRAALVDGLEERGYARAKGAKGVRGVRGLRLRSARWSAT